MGTTQPPPKKPPSSGPDIDAHVTLRKCCRTKLKKMDQLGATVAKASKLPVDALEPLLGPQDVLQAIDTVSDKPALLTLPASELSERVAKDRNDLAEAHAKEHTQKGENLEGYLWSLLHTSGRKLPKNIPPGPQYYILRYQDFVERHPDKTAPEYYLGYGQKYYDRFTKELRPKLSPAGQGWVDKAALNLQVAMEQKVGTSTSQKAAFDALELDNEGFQAFAVGAHCNAYLDAGLTQLSVAELWTIRGTPDPLDQIAGLTETACAIGPVAGQKAKDVGGVIGDILVRPAY